MTPRLFLVLNFALAFYNVGTIWAHEVDIFRTWKLLEPATFQHVQRVHWRKLPYWVFVPVGAAFMGSIGLLWYRPPGSYGWIPWGAFACQACAHVLTAALWGPWQAKLSKDELGPRSPYLGRILSTHWIRTALINAYAAILLVWLISVLP